MAKQEAEWSNRLSIFWLRKYGYLDGGQRFGGIKWTYGISGNENSLEFTVVTNGQEVQNESNYIRLQYTYTKRGTDEKEKMDYKIKLTTTPCYYGSVRYWFVCPIIKNGQHCGKRVGVLYGVGKYFGCRYCGNIAYSAQMRSGKFRGCSVSQSDIEKAKQEVKRKYYNGKTTRKYKRVIRMNEKLDDAFIKMNRMLEE